MVYNFVLWKACEYTSYGILMMLVVLRLSCNFLGINNWLVVKSGHWLSRKSDVSFDFHGAKVRNLFG